VKKHGFLESMFTVVCAARDGARDRSGNPVTENLGWSRMVTNSPGKLLTFALTELDKFTAKFALRPSARDEPTVVKDLETGISLITWTQKKSKFPVFRYPECERCPIPQYTKEARKKRLKGTMFLVATVTEQGVLQDIHVVKALTPIRQRGCRSGASLAIKASRRVDGNCSL